jgi:hypothetical protein
LARPLGEPKTGAREPIGGASPNKVRFEIDWRDPVKGQTVRIRVIHCRDYLGQSQDHIEIESIVPKKAPLGPFSQADQENRTVRNLIDAPRQSKRLLLRQPASIIEMLGHLVSFRLTRRYHPD